MEPELLKEGICAAAVFLTVLLALGQEYVTCTWTLPGPAGAGGFLLEIAVKRLEEVLLY